MDRKNQKMALCILWYSLFFVDPTMHVFEHNNVSFSFSLYMVANIRMHNFACDYLIRLQVNATCCKVNGSWFGTR